FGDQVIERMFQQRLHQIIRRVMRTGGGALVALGKVEFDIVVVLNENRLEFEQTFVNGAELLDIERSVIDADQLARLRFFIPPQRAQTAEQRIVAERACCKRPDCVGVEQVSGQWSNAEFLPGAVGFEQSEGRQQRQPQIMPAAVGQMALFRKAPQTLQAVIAVVNFALCLISPGRIDQIALFNYQQKQDSVDQSQ